MMFRSTGFRFLIVGILTIFMFVPLFFVGEVINSRAQYSRETIQNVSQEWGGAQRLGGPALVIPVEEDVVIKKRVEVVDPETGMVVVDPIKGNPRFRIVEETVTEQRPPIYLYPGRFDIDVVNTTEERHRGLFKVPVYKSTAQLGFEYDTDAVAEQLHRDETILWDKAEIQLPVGSIRALRGAAILRNQTGEFELEPLPTVEGLRSGIVAQVGDPRGLGALTLEIGFNGAQSLWLTPVGRITSASMQSDWPHPSFTGAFLPDNSDIRNDGFGATWTVPHLALALSQISRQPTDWQAQRQGSFGVEFYQPNDFYQKAFRAGRYGILFIALTFLTVLLVEDRANRPTHPVQYLLIGLAQSLFVVLMVAFAEQIGFGPAYAVAAGATIALLTLYGRTGLKLGQRTWVLGGALLTLYAVLYLILRTADFALLAGSLLCFCALAAAMYATRNEDWYGKPGSGPRKGWFSRKPKSPSPSGGAKAEAVSPPAGTSPAPA